MSKSKNKTNQGGHSKLPALLSVVVTPNYNRYIGWLNICIFEDQGEIGIKNLNLACMTIVHVQNHMKALAEVLFLARKSWG